MGRERNLKEKIIKLKSEIKVLKNQIAHLEDQLELACLFCNRLENYLCEKGVHRSVIEAIKKREVWNYVF